MKAKSYNGNQKENAIELALKIGVRPAARQLGINRTTITRWLKANDEFWANFK